MTQSAAVYTFESDRAGNGHRFGQLAAILDEHTTARIASLDRLAGRHCLEIGAGGGSVALWLADRVGPDGTVTATDKTPYPIPERANLTVLRHDITSDPLPEAPTPTGRWDLIHIRLVLTHLPERREILKALGSGLAPGGALLTEDWDGTYRDVVLSAPSPEVAALFNRYHDEALIRVLVANGMDPTWARQVHGAMISDGLTDVETVVHGRSWSGRSEYARLQVTNLDHLHDRLVEAGLSDAEQRELREVLMTDPRLVIRGLVTYSTMGRAR
jgi:SAM-dependent methyltransferase